MKYLLTLIVGLVAGGVLVYFLLVGAPRAAKPPGEAVRAPESAGDPPGTVVVTLDEPFFNTLLGGVFTAGQPTFKLASGEPRLVPAAPPLADGGRVVRTQQGCASQVALLPEGAGVKTGVRLADEKVQAVLAFTGSYNVLGYCQQFDGWAQADIELRFDQNSQTLFGDVNVGSVNLNLAGPAAMFSGAVSNFVRGLIQERINNFVLLREQQMTLALNVPTQNANATLRAKTKDVRREIKDGALRLHLTYDFAGAAAPQPSPPAS